MSSTKKEMDSMIIQGVLDSASVISYWAEDYDHDEKSLFITVMPELSDDGENGDMFQVPLKQLATSFRELATGNVVNSYLTDYAAQSLKSKDVFDVDIDSELSDATIQHAIFGEIVFG